MLFLLLPSNTLIRPFLTQNKFWTPHPLHHRSSFSRPVSILRGLAILARPTEPRELALHSEESAGDGQAGHRNGSGQWKIFIKMIDFLTLYEKTNTSPPAPPPSLHRKFSS